MHNITIYSSNTKILALDKDKKIYFLNLDIDKSFEKQLLQDGHLNIESMVDSSDFTKKYLQLMDNLTSKYQSKYWWATFTAAKNHQNIQLFDDLFSYHSLLAFLNRHKKVDLNILIIRPNRGIYKCIKRYCQGESIPIKIMGSNFSFTGTTIGLHIKNSIIALLRAFLLWYKMLVVKFIFWKKISDWIKDAKTKVFLLKSWFFANSFDQDGNYQEKVFGRLPDFFLKNNQKILVIGPIFCEISQFQNFVHKLLGAKDYMVVPQEYFLNFFDPLKVYFETLTNRPKVKKILENNHDITELVQFHLDLDFAKSFFNQLSYYPIMRNLLKNFQVDTYIYTYEQNPWEKMNLLAIRDYSPGTKTIAYQHTIVSMGKLNFYLSQQEKRFLPLPDRIVTNGEITREILISQNNPANKIVVGCALRFERLLLLRPRSLNYNKAILKVLLPLEGVLKSKEIINFVYAALKNNKRYQLILRPHPTLPIERMKDLLCFDLDNLPENIMLSKNEGIFQDLAICDFVVYDGTTVALEAVILGIPIIYININKKLNVDVLFQNKYLKKTVSAKDELVPAIEYFLDIEKNNFAEERVKAREYIKRYFYQVNDENLKAFLIKKV